MLLLLQVHNIHHTVVYHSTVLSPASLCIHSFLCFPYTSTCIDSSAPVVLLPELYLARFLLSGWRYCSLSPAKSAEHGAKFVCQRKILDPTLESYHCLVLQTSPWGRAPSITFLFASMSRLAWGEEEIQEGYP